MRINEITEPTFPIHPDESYKIPDVKVPWGMVQLLAPQLHKNHSQTPERLAQRGGLGVAEILTAIDPSRAELIKKAPFYYQVEVLKGLIKMYKEDPRNFLANARKPDK